MARITKRKDMLVVNVRVNLTTIDNILIWNTGETDPDTNLTIYEIKSPKLKNPYIKHNRRKRYFYLLREVLNRIIEETENGTKQTRPKFNKDKSKF